MVFWSKFLDAQAGKGEEEQKAQELTQRSAWAESATGSPEGVTDLAVRGKHQVMKGAPNNLSVILGGVFPTGKDDEFLSDCDLLKPSGQPGSGEFGVQLEQAYSRYLPTNVTLHASALCHYRYEDDVFQVGDGFDTSLTVAYRFTETVQDFPQVSIFGEMPNVYIGKDESGEIARKPNSSRSTLFLAPEVRIRFTEQVSSPLAPYVPVFQNLNENQLKTDFRVIGQLI